MLERFGHKDAPCCKRMAELQREPFSDCTAFLPTCPSPCWGANEDPCSLFINAGFFKETTIHRVEEQINVNSDNCFCPCSCGALTSESGGRSSRLEMKEGERLESFRQPQSKTAAARTGHVLRRERTVVVSDSRFFLCSGN